MNTITLNKRKEYAQGLRMGIPIGIGYFVVAFALGINAKEAGFSAGQAGLASMLLMASAGEYALFTLVSAGASYLEIAIMELVANARYLLMSCSLSQKLDDSVNLPKRFLIGQSVTDEMFGAAIARDHKVTTLFYFGMMCVAIPGWSIGTILGVLVGSVLPSDIVTALGVGLYGMFIAIVIPPCKKSTAIFLAVLTSAVSSCIFTLVPFFSGISEGVRTIILTIVISSVFAIFFPVDDNGKVITRKGGAEQ